MPDDSVKTLDNLLHSDKLRFPHVESESTDYTGVASTMEINYSISVSNV